MAGHDNDYYAAAARAPAATIGATMDATAFPGDRRRRRAGRRRDPRRRRRDADRDLPHALGDHRRRDLAEVREPAVHRVVQGTRRVQLPAAAARRRRGARRRRRVGRQPRAGRRLPRSPPRHPGHDRDAARHAVLEGHRHRTPRCRDRARGRRVRGRARRPARRIADERGATLVPAFDDPAVIAGQGTVALEMLDAAPRPRRARRTGRRRRARSRAWRSPRRTAAPASRSSGCRARATRACSPRSAATRPAPAGRRSRKASRSRRPAS